MKYKSHTALCHLAILLYVAGILCFVQGLVRWWSEPISTHVFTYAAAFFAPATICTLFYLGFDFIHNVPTFKPLELPQPEIVFPRPGPTLAGYVYLIREPGGLYKIGHSTNPKKRLSSLRGQTPYALQLELVHTIRCNNRYEAESQLHKRYADKRVRGEWFRLDPDDVQAIRKIKSL